MSQPAIIVHGGAGKWKDYKIPIGMEYVEKAARIGFQILVNNGSALDAAEACTVFMESCGKLNAGVGATRNQDGVQELDAMIVDGYAMDFGSVAAIKGIQNPISVARYIMERTEYSFFAGESASELYKQMVVEGYRVESDQRIIPPFYDNSVSDTVGCVTFDITGRFAATSSTGGIKEKRAGRIGDSPIIGSGAFADDICGVSATGQGEHIMRVTLSRLVAFHIGQGEDVQTSTELAMNTFEKKTGSEAGIVALDKEGNFGKTTNCKAMPTTVIRGDLDSILVFER